MDVTFIESVTSCSVISRRVSVVIKTGSNTQKQGYEIWLIKLVLDIKSLEVLGAHTVFGCGSTEVRLCVLQSN